MGEGASIFEWAMGGILFLAISTSLCNNTNNHRSASQLYQSYSQRAQTKYTRSLLSTAESYALADRPLRMQFI